MEEREASNYRRVGPGTVLDRRGPVTAHASTTRKATYRVTGWRRARVLEGIRRGRVCAIRRTELGGVCREVNPLEESSLTRTCYPPPYLRSIEFEIAASYLDDVEDGAGRRGWTPPRMIEESDAESLFGPVIFAYTRKQAIADGVLVDVTETAKEAGFQVPVAVTHAVWAEYVAVPEGVEGQDEAGRLWDVLWMCRFGIAQGENRDAREFLLSAPRPERQPGGRPAACELKGRLRPG